MTFWPLRTSLHFDVPFGLPRFNPFSVLFTHADFLKSTDYCWVLPADWLWKKGLSVFDRCTALAKVSQNAFGIGNRFGS